ncbi:MAG: hypothetical protein WBG90_00900 [Saonia sp.]
MKNIVIVLFLLVSYFGTSQAVLNDYKYIIVPKNFDSFKKENQYQTSSLVKFLFNKKNFNVVYDDAMPEDLVRNRCLGLLVDLVDNSSMFSTKTKIVLKDCTSQEVFATQEGKSKLKEYRPSYAEAIRGAFRSFDGISYNYEPKEDKSDTPITVSFKNDVMKSEEEVQENTAGKEMVEQEATPENQSFKSREPVESNIKKAEANQQKEMVSASDVSISVVKASSVLYAQELPNGYQLVDNTPKIQLTIFKSSIPDMYLAKTDEQDGVVYKKDGKWFFEYYKNENLIVEELNIKF